MSQAIADRAKAVAPGRSQGQNLRVVPIRGPSDDQPPYELLRPETLPFVQITEISQAGSVPELQVHNKLDVRVFLMDGQELIGAKQNRILNTDVLVPANSTLKLPVSCVEQGRWHHVSNTFSGGKSASHHIRAAKLGRVHASLKTKGEHDANQAAVWQDVEHVLDGSGTSSPTMALSDAYAKRQSQLTEFRRGLRLPPKTVGLAMFHGGRFQGLDLFDKWSTVQYFWDSLVDSYAIDLLETPVDPGQPPASNEAQVIRSLLDRTIDGSWESFKSPGEGMEWRLQESDIAAAALVWNYSVVVHLQILPKLAGSGDGTTVYRPRIHRPNPPPAGEEGVVY